MKNNRFLFILLLILSIFYSISGYFIFNLQGFFLRTILKENIVYLNIYGNYLFKLKYILLLFFVALYSIIYLKYVFKSSSVVLFLIVLVILTVISFAITFFSLKNLNQVHLGVVENNIIYSDKAIFFLPFIFNSILLLLNILLIKFRNSFLKRNRL